MTDDEREGLARAIEAAPNDRNAMAIAALAYLAPIRAREIAAAEARERARVVAAAEAIAMREFRDAAASSAGYRDQHCHAAEAERHRAKTAERIASEIRALSERGEHRGAGE